MDATRRKFLYGSLVAGGAFALRGLNLYSEALASSGYSNLLATRGNGGYGPLRPVKAANADETYLALPEGFQYTVFSKTGAPMADGNPTPPRHDGMAAFAANGRIHLVRNHEINNRIGKAGLALGDPKRAYDPLAGGGTTTLVIDPKTRQVVKDYVSLSGTLQNCAGGPTPWGSWITCEETILGKTKITGSQDQQWGGFEQNHGYCFEVPAFAEGMVAPVPLKAMGRFVHEAIAVDPKTGIVYETEDNNPSGLYRFIPKRKGKLAEGGKLQMLAIKGRPDFDTRMGQKAGERLPVEWVDIANPDPAEADTDSHAVFNQGKAKGGASFARLEGCWYGNGSIFITATSGGNQRLGQVWEYNPKGNYLTLIFESPSAEVMEMPDNICVSPRGGLVVCEDGRGDNYVRGLTQKGQIFDFANNIMPSVGPEKGEFAGATFSPDGQTLFVNIQSPGVTFAIWGPWKDGAL